MSSLTKRLAARPAGAALREAALLWCMRGAMLGYGLVMLAAAEAAISALRRLF